jgi:indole-3-glycerol phosphate synthase
MYDSLRREHVAVIAEVKRSSPSKGAINPGIASGLQAASYERGGASAVSVLTEPEKFGGKSGDVIEVLGATRLPVLRKDFLVTTAQLVETASLGATAILLIVRAIEPNRLAGLSRAAAELGLEILFEVRDERELERALAAGARIIGVNNRDLETLQVHPETVGRIVPLIPPDCVAVAESGYSTREDVMTAAAAGADAVLVGSSLSAALDPEAAVRAIAQVPRSSRVS